MRKRVTAAAPRRNSGRMAGQISMLTAMNRARSMSRSTVARASNS